jgi:hypothetical protein
MAHIDKFNYVNGWMRRRQSATMSNQHNAVVNWLKAEIKQEMLKLHRKVNKATASDSDNHIMTIVAESPPIYRWEPLTSLILRDITTDTSTGNVDALWKFTMSATDPGQLVLIKL